jgi:hypothetical protein
MKCSIVFSAVPAMDLDSLYSDYSLEEQDFYAAASPHKILSGDCLVSRETSVHTLVRVCNVFTNNTTYDLQGILIIQQFQNVSSVSTLILQFLI